MTDPGTRRMAPGSVLFVFLLVAILTPGTFARQKAQSNQKSADPFRVVASWVGSKGKTEGAKYIVEDQRTSFRVPRDKRVVVYFEWEGPPGAHHFTGTWIEPSGKVEGTGSFDYVATGNKLFGYWVLDLNSAVPRGLWALEAKIDGQPAGERTFRITGPPPPPTTAQLYQQVSASSVFITALDSNGEHIRTGSGFFIRPGVVLTTFGVIDGSSSLQIRLPKGSTQETESVLAANRKQDWALLVVKGTKTPALKMARPGSWKVGDVCYVTGSPSPGSRSITPVPITGILNSKTAGQRFTISWSGDGRAMGSPVLNTQGRVIGIVKVSPSFEASNEVSASAGSHRTAAAAPAGREVISTAVVPQPAPTANPETLAELAAKGEFVLPVARDSQIVFGYLCRDYRQEGDSLEPTVVTSQFFHRDRQIAIVVMWNPNRKIKSTSQVRIYNTEDNELALESKPAKIHLGRRAAAYSGWRVKILSLPPGVYRADVLLGNTPEWRGYFRIHR